jgi:hypothetical protein
VQFTVRRSLAIVAALAALAAGLFATTLTQSSAAACTPVMQASGLGTYANGYVQLFKDMKCSSFAVYGKLTGAKGDYVYLEAAGRRLTPNATITSNGWVNTQTVNVLPGTAVYVVAVRNTIGGLVSTKVRFTA